MSKVINITLTDEEYEELNIKAQDVTVNQFIKNILFPNNDFNKWFPELKKRVEELSDNTQFNIRIVMATDWMKIPKGIRLALGRVFYQQVDCGNIDSVRVLELDANKTQWYEKTSLEGGCDNE
ncbi:MAG: DUF1413 domain-containing protein [Lachnospiraceae bacterium]|nr:DUF1413 domain-containing protein [Lachnospiraceae bacterium]